MFCVSRLRRKAGLASESGLGLSDLLCERGLLGVSSLSGAAGDQCLLGGVGMGVVGAGADGLLSSAQ